MTEAAGAGVSFDELRLAARNHAMPLEALHYHVTPPWTMIPPKRERSAASAS